MSCIHCGADLIHAAVGRKKKMYCSRECISKYRATKNQNDTAFKLSQIFNSAKSRAKRYGLPFNLTQEYVQGLYDGSNGHCPLTGRKFDWTPHPVYRNNPNTATLDRIIPEKGYTIGNVRLMNYHANIAINQYGLEALMKLLTDIQETSYSR